VQPIGNGAKYTIGLQVVGNKEIVALLYNSVTQVIHLIGLDVLLKLLMSYLKSFSLYQIGLAKMFVVLTVPHGINTQVVKIMLNH